MSTRRGADDPPDTTCFHGPGDAVFLTCTSCLTLTGKRLLPQQTGIFVAPCTSCGRPLRVVLEQVPVGGYGVTSESASPDRSAVAMRLQLEERQSTWVTAMHPSSRRGAGDGFPDLQKRLDRLSELRDFEERTRDQVAHDPSLAELYDNLIFEEQHKILRTDDEDPER